MITLRADLSDPLALNQAIEGKDVVFHVAAKAGVWGRRRDYVQTNIHGTHNVLAACRAGGVGRLVYTSSPSVCFDGSDHTMAGPNLPYASNFLAHYPATKAEAERLILAENSPALATCALRPHLIFGPGDPHILPRIVQAARTGKLARIGDGSNEVTLCFVENAALAHVLAADTLSAEAPHAGRAFFIGQEQPVLLWEWIDEVLRGLDISPPGRQLSQGTAYAMGALLEFLWQVLPMPGEPRMTRFVANQLATSHSYTMQPAADAFGYAEETDLRSATNATIDWLARGM